MFRYAICELWKASGMTGPFIRAMVAWWCARVHVERPKRQVMLPPCEKFIDTQPVVADLHHRTGHLLPPDLRMDVKNDSRTAFCVSSVPPTDHRLRFSYTTHTAPLIHRRCHANANAAAVLDEAACTAALCETSIFTSFKPIAN